MNKQSVSIVLGSTFLAGLLICGAHAHQSLANPAFKNGFLQIPLHGKLPIKDNLGLIDSIIFDVDIELEASPDNIVKVISNRSINIPPQKFSTTLLLSGNQSLPVSFTASPSFVLNSSTKNVCNLSIENIKFNISNIQSTILQKWILNSVQNYINKEDNKGADSILSKILTNKLNDTIRDQRPKLGCS